MKKIKIGILRCSNTYNYGSMMLGENAIYYLNKILKRKKIEPIFLIYTNCLENIGRLKKATGCSNIEMRTPIDYGVSIVGRKFKKIVEMLNFFFRGREKTKEYQNISECDFLLVLGGDNFAGYGAIWNLLDIYLVNKSDNLFFISQTIGPFSMCDKEIALRIFNKVDFPIYVRDKNSMAYCKKELGLQNIKFAPDLAFLDLAQQQVGDKKKYITLVVSGLAMRYSDNLEDYLQSIEEIITYLQTKLKYNERLLLLPHVISDPYWFGESSSDRMMMRKIIKRNNFPNIKFVFSDLLPYQARKYFSESRFVVSGRMHGCISSFQVGIPALALSYSVKYKGVIGRELGFPELVVECSGVLSQKISIIKRKIDLLDKKHGVYSRKISKKIESIKRLSKKPLEEMADFIENIEKKKL